MHELDVDWWKLSILMLVAIKSAPAGAGMEILPVVSRCTTSQLHDVLLLLYKDKRTQKAPGMSLCQRKNWARDGNFQESHKLCSSVWRQPAVSAFWSNVIFSFMVKAQWFLFFIEFIQRYHQISKRFIG